jgi:hypothetical protein
LHKKTMWSDYNSLLSEIFIKTMITDIK